MWRYVACRIVSVVNRINPSEWRGVRARGVLGSTYGVNYRLCDYSGTELSRIINQKLELELELVGGDSGLGLEWRKLN